MIYHVYCDGVSIYDLDFKTLVLLSPKVTNELNNSGSFEFALPPMHRNYDGLIKPMLSTIQVFKGDSVIFTGRPIEFKTSFNRDKMIYCEGALAYFHDSVQTPVEYDSITVKNWLQHLIDVHNGQVSANRQFKLGRVTLDPDVKVYRKIDRVDTCECIEHMISMRGGYFMTRYEDGANYLDYLSEETIKENAIKQPVEFGLNMLDYTQDFNLEDIATCLIPLGDTPEGAEEPLTVASVNGGSEIVEDPDLIKTYGRIVKTETFEGYRDPSSLLRKAKEYLKTLQWNNLTIEAKAAELHFLNGEWPQFELGQYVRVISKPHGIDNWYPLSKIEVNLDEGAQTVTLGNQKRDTLSEQVKETKQSQETADELDNLKDDIDDVKDDYDSMQNDINDMQSDINDLKESGGGGGDGWTHQLNGSEGGQHTVNFITE